MKNTLITLLLAILIVIIYLACSKLIPIEQYQNFTIAFVFGLSFSLLLGRIHKDRNQKQLGQMIGNAVRNIIKSEQRQSGLLSKNNNPKDPNVSTTTIEDCRKRLVDTDGIVQSTRPLTEMKLQWGNPKDEQP